MSLPHEGGSPPLEGGDRTCEAISNQLSELEISYFQTKEISLPQYAETKALLLQELHHLKALEKEKFDRETEKLKFTDLDEENGDEILCQPDAQETKVKIAKFLKEDSTGPSKTKKKTNKNTNKKKGKINTKKEPKNKQEKEAQEDADTNQKNETENQEINTNQQYSVNIPTKNVFEILTDSEDSEEIVLQKIITKSKDKRQDAINSTSTNASLKKPSDTKQEKQTSKSNTLTQENQKKEKIPPIFILPEDNWRKVLKNIANYIEEEPEAKLVGELIKIFPNTANQYCCIIHYKLESIM